jgi:hypothetical protein
VWDVIDMKATEDTHAPHSADFHFDQHIGW